MAIGQGWLKGKGSVVAWDPFHHKRDCHLLANHLDRAASIHFPFSKSKLKANQKAVSLPSNPSPFPIFVAPLNKTGRINYVVLAYSALLVGMRPQQGEKSCNVGSLGANHLMPPLLLEN